jgi:hypothetical protein
MEPRGQVDGEGMPWVLPVFLALALFALPLMLKIRQQAKKDPRSGLELAERSYRLEVGWFRYAQLPFGVGLFLYGALKGRPAAGVLLGSLWIAIGWWRVALERRTVEKSRGRVDRAD